MGDDDFITVPVMVRKDQVGELYALVGGLGNGRAMTDGTGGGAGRSGDITWKASDGAIAEAVVAAGNKNARAIYRLLVENAGRWVGPEELDAVVGMTGLRRVGVLGSMGKSCKHRGREAPWNWDGTNYMMPPENAALFRRALARQ